VVEGFRFQRVVARQLHGHVRRGDLSLIFGMVLILFLAVAIAD
jgi:hypothetical protein